MTMAEEYPDDDTDEMYLVLLHPAMTRAFKRWLKQRNFILARDSELEDDGMKTYIAMIGPD